MSGIGVQVPLVVYATFSVLGLLCLLIAVGFYKFLARLIVIRLITSLKERELDKTFEKNLEKNSDGERVSRRRSSADSTGPTGPRSLKS